MRELENIKFICHKEGNPKYNCLKKECLKFGIICEYLEIREGY